MPMIDIHAHVLPQVDDGPKSWGESLALLRGAVDDGIAGVVCTSHVIDRLDARIEDVFVQKFEELQKRVRDAGLEIQLWLGAEIHTYTQFDVHSRLATLNGNGKYLLIEFPMAGVPADAPALFGRFIAQGVRPILAHPERNQVVLKQPSKAYEYIQGGALLQLNAGSLVGDFGRRVRGVARALLEHRMVHFFASDGHSTEGRPVALSRAYEAVARDYGEETAETLFCVNPLKAVEGEPIDSPQPVLPEDGRIRRGRFMRKLF